MHHMCLVLMSEFDETGRTQTASLILIKVVFGYQFYGGPGWT
jgi:hypothetical protein